MSTKDEATRSLLAVVGTCRCAKTLRRKSIESKERAIRAQKEKADALQRKREEAERKARRGEIEPTHEFTFLLIGQVNLWHSNMFNNCLVRL